MITNKVTMGGDNIIYDKPIIKSRLDPSILAILIICTTGCFALFGYHDIVEWYNSTTGTKILFGFFGITGIGSSYAIWKIDTILIFADRAEIRSPTNKTRKVVFFNEIDNFSEHDGQSDYHSYSLLTLYMGNTYYRLSSTPYRNYDELKNAITRGKTRID